jgi:carboxyl-terminal processing protease
LWSAEEGVRVLDTVADGPAARAGLLVGDRLVAIEGVPVDALTAQQVHEQLAGEVGSSVELTVDRNGQWETLTVERAPYHTASSRSP